MNRPPPTTATGRDGRQPLLSVEHLGCVIGTPRGPLRAVHDVSFTLDRGRTLGIVGESGSGKSMLVRAVMGIAPPAAATSGRVVFDGTDLRGAPEPVVRGVLGRRIAMVFQDPMTSLNPVVRIGRQLTEATRKHLGLSRDQARQRAVGLLEQVGIPEPRARLRAYPHQLSGGMRQRVTIAMALACDPELLIADEATTALDVTVAKQILDLLTRLQRERGMAMIMVSHDLGVVAGRTDDLAVMYAGRIVEQAPTRVLFPRHRHRYTEALLQAVPRLDHPRHTLFHAIPGAPPDLVHPPGGCAFAPRCPAAVPECGQRPPPMVDAGDPAHRHACLVPAGAGRPDAAGRPQEVPHA